MPNILDVSPDGAGGWNVSVAGGLDSVCSERTKEEALNVARTIAKFYGPSRVDVHGEDGGIEQQIGLGL